ncbi:hypothetical protein ACFSBZ_09680 [Amnibacterium flavum]|uniref:LPXTG cell wall anchor domain-containing protein n=1 Tax=Amnibacterium flavum TaxID=2173173 RepID=A0A2V1HRC9_9MICO|nr:hypothetical protein DDQ50_00910 [Amnibacterium flavum]
MTPTDVRLGTTGVDVSTWVVVAGAAIALGVLLLAIVLIRRRGRGSGKGTGSGRSRTLVGVSLALILASALSISPGQRAQAAEATSGTCELLSWSLLQGSSTSSTTVGAIPQELTTVDLTNITTFPIEISFRTQVTQDTGDLAPWVRLVGDCALCNPAAMYDDVLSSTTAGPATRVEAGQTIRVVFEGSLVSSAPASTQNQSAVYNLVASAAQIP